MNAQTAPCPQHLIASPVRCNLSGQQSQSSLSGWGAYAYPDEEISGDPAGAPTLSHPELFGLFSVDPDEIQAIVDGFLS